MGEEWGEQADRAVLTAGDAGAVVSGRHQRGAAVDQSGEGSDAGVVPALRLGESAGQYHLLEEALTVDSPNATAKTTCAVGGMLAAAHSIVDLQTRVDGHRSGPD